MAAGYEIAATTALLLMVSGSAVLPPQRKQQQNQSGPSAVIPLYLLPLTKTAPELPHARRPPPSLLLEQAE